MIVTAWNNGKHHRSGAGYGFKLRAEDRDQEINKSWKTITVQLPNGTKVVSNIDKDSFWSNTCREIINADFGQWLIASKHVPWPKGQPPKFQLKKVSGRNFKLEGI